MVHVISRIGYYYTLCCYGLSSSMTLIELSYSSISFACMLACEQETCMILSFLLISNNAMELIGLTHSCPWPHISSIFFYFFSKNKTLFYSFYFIIEDINVLHLEHDITLCSSVCKRHASSSKKNDKNIQASSLLLSLFTSNQLPLKIIFC